jgi:hypothetical protein
MRCSSRRRPFFNVFKYPCQPPFWNGHVLTRPLYNSLLATLLTTEFSAPASPIIHISCLHWSQNCLLSTMKGSISRLLIGLSVLVPLVVSGRVHGDALSSSSWTPSGSDVAPSLIHQKEAKNAGDMERDKPCFWVT